MKFICAILLGLCITLSSELAATSFQSVENILSNYFENTAGKLSDKDMQTMMTKVGLALGDLHYKNAVHGDFQPTNILYDPLTKKVQFIKPSASAVKVNQSDDLFRFYMQTKYKPYEGAFIPAPEAFNNMFGKFNEGYAQAFPRRRHNNIKQENFNLFKGWTLDIANRLRTGNAIEIDDKEQESSPWNTFVRNYQKSNHLEIYKELLKNDPWGSEAAEMPRVEAVSLPIRRSYPLSEAYSYVPRMPILSRADDSFCTYTCTSLGYCNSRVNAIDCLNRCPASYTRVWDNCARNEQITYPGPWCDRWNHSTYCSENWWNSRREQWGARNWSGYDPGLQLGYLAPLIGQLLLPSQQQPISPWQLGLFDDQVSHLQDLQRQQLLDTQQQAQLDVLQQQLLQLRQQALSQPVVVQAQPAPVIVAGTPSIAAASTAPLVQPTPAEPKKESEPARTPEAAPQKEPEPAKAPEAAPKKEAAKEPEPAKAQEAAPKKDATQEPEKPKETAVPPKPDPMMPKEPVKASPKLEKRAPEPQQDRERGSPTRRTGASTSTRQVKSPEVQTQARQPQAAPQQQPTERRGRPERGKAPAPVAQPAQGTEKSPDKDSEEAAEKKGAASGKQKVRGKN